jgi:hypothetical protein
VGQAPAFDFRSEFLAQWEGNRRLTLRVASALPPARLFDHAPVPSRRPFGAMAVEIARLEQAYVRGLAEGRWSFGEAALRTPREDPFGGGPPARPYDWLLYALEDEVHHGGQGYDYLRALGIAPPLFCER